MNSLNSVEAIVDSMNIISVSLTVSNEAVELAPSLRNDLRSGGCGGGSNYRRVGVAGPVSAAAVVRAHGLRYFCFSNDHKRQGAVHAVQLEGDTVQFAALLVWLFHYCEQYA